MDAPPKIYLISDQRDYDALRLALLLPRYAIVRLTDPLVLRGRSQVWVADLSREPYDMDTTRLLLQAHAMDYQGRLRWLTMADVHALARRWTAHERTLRVA